MKLTAVHKQLLSKIYVTMTEEDLNEIGDFDSTSQQENFVFLRIAIRNCEPAGFVLLERDFSDARSRSVGTIIGVVHKFRGTDVSTELINAANRFFADSDLEQWCFIVNTSNVASQKFAKKHGFTYAWEHSSKENYLYLQ